VRCRVPLRRNEAAAAAPLTLHDGKDLQASFLKVNEVDWREWDWKRAIKDAKSAVTGSKIFAATQNRIMSRTPNICVRACEGWVAG
jgi:hypothetical protein